jgi:hypothetical protein
MESLRDGQRRRQLGIFALGCGVFEFGRPRNPFLTPVFVQLIEAGVGAVVGVGVAFRVRKTEVIGRYALAAGGTFGWTALGFSG